MIPLFPKFKKLELTDEDEIRGITDAMLPYSDFNFVSMWCWNIIDKIEISLLSGNLVVRFVYYNTTDEYFYSLIGRNEVEKAIDTLLHYSKETLGVNSLRLVPGHVVDMINGKEKYLLSEERGEFDYVYDIEQIYGYGGRKLKQKRWLVRDFLEKYRDSKVELLDFLNPKIQNDVISIARMAEDKSDNNHDADSDDVVAAIRFVDFAKTNPESIVALGVYIESVLAIFNITEIVHGDWAIVHFEKSNFKRYPESGAYIFQELMKVLRERGVRYINLEQDLDIEGLRANKLSYRPSSFLKKYRISPQ